MKNKDEILLKWWNKQNQEGLSTNDCLINAMEEWAEEYHRQHSAKPPVIKTVCAHKNIGHSEFCGGDFCKDCGKVLY